MKMKFPWIENHNSEKDPVLTMAVWSVLVILAKFAITGITLKIAGKDIALGSFDTGAATALLAATLGAWVMQHYSASKFNGGSLNPNSPPIPFTAPEAKKLLQEQLVSPVQPLPEEEKK